MFCRLSSNCPWESSKPRPREDFLIPSIATPRSNLPSSWPVGRFKASSTVRQLVEEAEEGWGCSQNKASVNMASVREGGRALYLVLYQAIKAPVRHRTVLYAINSSFSFTHNSERLMLATEYGILHMDRRKFSR